MITYHDIIQHERLGHVRLHSLHSLRVFVRALLSLVRAYGRLHHHARILHAALSHGREARISPTKSERESTLPQCV